MQWRRKQWLPWGEKAESPNARVEPKTLKTILGPGTKLIIMLRDPVDFLASLPPWWTERVKDVGGDCYADGVERWLNEFPRSNVLVLKMEQYVERPQEVLDAVFEFLGVPSFTVEGTAPQSGRRRHSKDSIDIKQRAKYHSDPRNVECKERLEQLTGLK